MRFGEDTGNAEGLFYLGNVLKAHVLDGQPASGVVAWDRPALRRETAKAASCSAMVPEARYDHIMHVWPRWLAVQAFLRSDEAAARGDRVLSGASEAVSMRRGLGFRNSPLAPTSPFPT